MADDPHQPAEYGWTLPQRRALIALLAVLLAVLAFRYAVNRAYTPDPQPPRGARADELASRIDPNVADWQTLAAIPGLGEKRARQIAEYRIRAQEGAPGAIVFHQATDLLRVRGIGRATMENLRPYLIFPPTEHPATVP